MNKTKTKDRYDTLAEHICAPVKHLVDEPSYSEWQRTVAARLRKEAERINQTIGILKDEPKPLTDAESDSLKAIVNMVEKSQ